VYPFAWEAYHNGSTLLTHPDLQIEITEPHNAVRPHSSGCHIWWDRPPIRCGIRTEIESAVRLLLIQWRCPAGPRGGGQGADGLVVWGSLWEPGTKSQPNAQWGPYGKDSPYMDYVRTQTGPMIQHFRAAAADCAKAVRAD
jgi:hypothetical protein